MSRHYCKLNAGTLAEQTISTKLPSGGTLPALTLPLVRGGETTLGKTAAPGAWQIVIVYRGLHCPICNKCLERLEELREGFARAGADSIAVSADPLEKAQTMVARNGLNFPVAYSLNIGQMRELGLYISEPRSAEERRGDRSSVCRARNVHDQRRRSSATH